MRESQTLGSVHAGSSRRARRPLEGGQNQPEIDQPPDREGISPAGSIGGLSCGIGNWSPSNPWKGGVTKGGAGEGQRKGSG